MSKGKLIRTLEKGDHFGERAILLDSNRTMDIMARTKCTCYSISIETLKSMVGEHYRDILYLNFIKSSFSKSAFFNKFNLKLLENAYPLFKSKNFLENKEVFKSGHVKSQNLVVVIDGNLINVMKILNL
jgi:hypothetical protein